MTATDWNRNKWVSQNWVNVENGFKRFDTLRVFSKNCKWDGSEYNLFIQIEVALTNDSMVFNSLRDSYRCLFVTVYSHLFTMKKNNFKKRANSQAVCRDKRQKKLFGSEVENFQTTDFGVLSLMKILIWEYCLEEKVVPIFK